MTETQKPFSGWKNRALAGITIVGTLALTATAVLAVNNINYSPNITSLTPAYTVAGIDGTQIVTEDGTRYVRGNNINGQLGVNNGENVISNWTKADGPAFTKISGSYNHSLGITEDASIYGWGSSPYGNAGNKTAQPVATPTKITVSKPYEMLSSGPDFVLGIDRAGNLLSWGQNDFGQLGTGNKKSETSPQYLLMGTKFKNVKAGKNFSAAIDTNGNLYMWGANDKGQLGNSTFDEQLKPQLIEGKKWSSIGTSLNSETMSAIDTNGQLYTWGSNIHGQLGNGTDWRYEQKVENERIEKEKARLKANDEARRTALINEIKVERNAELDKWDEEVKVWERELAEWENLYEPKPTPTPVPTPTATSIPTPTPSPTPTPTIDPEDIPDKPVKPEEPKWDKTPEEIVDSTFKYTDLSHLVPKTIVAPALKGNSNKPEHVAKNFTFIQSTMGSENGFAIDANNRLYAWGEDHNGQTAIGVDKNTVTQVPVRTNGDRWYSEVSAGYRFAAAITTNNVMYLWGSGNDAGSTLDKEKLVDMKNVQKDVKHVFLGEKTGYLTTTDDESYVWGQNEGGAGVDSDQNLTNFTKQKARFVLIAPSSNGVVALNMNKQLTIWGSNIDGIFGSGDNKKDNTPITQVVVGKFIDVAAGNGFSVVLDNDGSVWAFGRGSDGQTGPLDSADTVFEPIIVPLPVKVKAVGANEDTSFAVGVDNSIWVWGDGNKNPQKIGQADQEIIKLVTGAFSVQVLGKEGGVWEWSSNGSNGLVDDTVTDTLRKANISFAVKDIVAAGAGAYITNAKGHLYGYGTISFSEGQHSLHEIVLVDDTRLYTSMSMSATHEIFMTNEGTLFGLGTEPFGTFENDTSSITKLRAIKFFEKETAK